MKRVAILLLLFCPWAWCDVNVGEPAPPVQLQALVFNQPLDPALKAMKGKALVLEFWGTFCGPCIAAIPHLNELAEKFSGQPVQFLSVTAEPSAVVEAFLKSHPIHSLVGIDRSGAMTKAYGAQAVPRTVLISAEGKVAAITYPDSLNEKSIEDLIAGRPLNLPTMTLPDFSLRGAAKNESAPLLDMMVRKSAVGEEATMTSGSTWFAVKALPIRDILANAYQMQMHFVVGEAAEDPTHYDVNLVAPGASEARFQELLPSLLSLALHVTARKEMRNAEGWVLKAPNGRPEVLKPANSYKGSSLAGKGRVEVVSTDMKGLTQMIGFVLGKPVADKTGLTGKFDFRVDYDSKRAESLLDALRKMGFTLEPAVVPTEFLVVTQQ
jgi:uncharacterized protein (TIGR03435 family)